MAIFLLKRNLTNFKTGYGSVLDRNLSNDPVKRDPFANGIPTQ